MRDQLAKFDVRVRDRMFRRGTLTPAAVAAHLEGLKDTADQAEDITFPQPALQAAEAPTPAEPRVAFLGAAATRATASSAAAPDSGLDEDEDDDDEDDDEDEDDDDAVKKEGDE